MNQFRSVFEAIGELPPSQQEGFLKASKNIIVPSKTILQAEGKTADKIYLIEKGTARTFYYKDGKDITYWIGAEGEFIGSVASFFGRTPSTKLVETIEECELWEFDYFILEEIFHTNLEMATVGRKFTNHALVLMEKRFDIIHFHSAAEKYEHLIQNRPDIINRVPLNYIASFLGISQETLSRIRAQQ